MENIRPAFDLINNCSRPGERRKLSRTKYDRLKHISVLRQKKKNKSRLLRTKRMPSHSFALQTWKEIGRKGGQEVFFLISCPMPRHAGQEMRALFACTGGFVPEETPPSVIPTQSTPCNSAFLPPCDPTQAEFPFYSALDAVTPTLVLFLCTQSLITKIWNKHTCIFFLWGGLFFSFSWSVSLPISHTHTHVRVLLQLGDTVISSISRLKPENLSNMSSTHIKFQ